MSSTDHNLKPSSTPKLLLVLTRASCFWPHPHGVLLVRLSKRGSQFLGYSSCRPIEHLMKTACLCLGFCSPWYGLAVQLKLQCLPYCVQTEFGEGPPNILM